MTTTTPTLADVENMLFALRRRDDEAPEPMTLEQLEDSLEQWVSLEVVTFCLYSIDEHEAQRAQIDELLHVVQGHLQAVRLRIAEHSHPGWVRPHHRDPDELAVSS
jgi:hypothetical protein